MHTHTGEGTLCSCVCLSHSSSRETAQQHTHDGLHTLTHTSKCVCVCWWLHPFVHPPPAPGAELGCNHDNVSSLSILTPFQEAAVFCRSGRGLLTSEIRSTNQRLEVQSKDLRSKRFDPLKVITHTNIIYSHFCKVSTGIHPLLHQSGLDAEALPLVTDDS